jgi:hypothetical protein
MPRPDNTFDKLAGVPVHYDRYPNPQYGYGTRGKPHTWRCTTPFENKLNAAFQELWDVCPLGRAEVITTAGAFVNKPGLHGKGRGFDVDGIFWANRAFITKNYPDDRSFYLAVEAVLRKHFGTVLNYEYNVDHQDHLHIDDGTETGFVPDHRSRVLFLQMALTHVFERPVTIDGMIGPETNGAARDLLLALDLADDGEVVDPTELHQTLDEQWSTLLDHAAKNGFGRAGLEERKEDTPLDLLEDVYELISRELLGHPGRKTLETAVTAFAEHPKTDEWLDEFREDD